MSSHDKETKKQCSRKRINLLNVGLALYLAIAAFISSLESCGGSFVVGQTLGISMLIVVLAGPLIHVMRHRQKRPARRAIEGAVLLLGFLFITTLSSRLAQLDYSNSVSVPATLIQLFAMPPNTGCH